MVQSGLLSDSHRPPNAKPFPSSDSLAKVQEVASWLLEMNPDLLGGGSRRRRRGSAAGNASSSARAPREAAAGEEGGEEEDRMDRVLEEEQQQEEEEQQRRERERERAPAGSGPEAEVNGESAENGPRKGARWAWDPERPEEDEEEENNNSGRLDEEDEEDEEEEEMDQDSDDFENSEDSGREEDGEEGGRLHSPSLRNNTSDPNDNVEVSSEQHPRTPASPFKTKGRRSSLTAMGNRTMKRVALLLVSPIRAPVALISEPALPLFWLSASLLSFLSD
ncbi:hypothetical protein MATL_G00194010 [Megalops atlanticus]|uniref:Uncharacterized protein n=1 Tax=Megalops atlanticus TaxID=7932 RepID=A0A9D3PLG1_MEGAT|nr:hypothetical protein MATL_G00194010 [Megalops atlanticus]